MDTTSPYLQGHLTLEMPPCVLKRRPVSDAKVLSAESLFSFLFSFWHGKTKSVAVNPELHWDMDLTRGKHLPLAKANKTKVQRASKPECINVTAPGKRGDQRTVMKSPFSRGAGERLPCCVQGVCWGAGHKCWKNSRDHGAGPGEAAWVGCSRRAPWRTHRRLASPS